MNDDAAERGAGHALDRIDVVAAALERDGRYLLGRRPPTSRNADRWEFPGGKVDRGESHAEALVRELREELGIEVEVGERLLQIEHDDSHQPLTLTLYACRLRRGVPQPRYHQEVSWFLLSEVDRSRLAAADRELVDRLS